MKSFTFFAFIALGSLLASCADGPEDLAPAPEEISLKQGINLLDLQPDFSFSAAYVKGTDVIYLQAVRGQPTPEKYRNDPAYPQFEVDARITDQDGRLLYIQRGGDDFVDPSWFDDLVWQDNLPAGISNRVHFEMVGEAANALEAELAKLGQRMDERLTPELRAIREFGRSAPAAYEASEREFDEYVARHGLFQIEAGGGGTTGPEDAVKNLYAGYYSIAVHDMSCCSGFGRHSATRIKRNHGGGFYTYYDFCNHGTCAYQMPQKCLLPMINKPAWTAPTCGTSYSAWSNSGGHNCHDDTRLQLAAYAYGPSLSRYNLWCDDGDNNTVDISDGIGDQSGSPECTDSVNKGYNHPNMLKLSSAVNVPVGFNLTLSANVTYSFSTCGTTSADTELQLVKDGNPVASNDSYCGAQAQITYTAPTTGTYTLYAKCPRGTSCGGRVNVKQVSAVGAGPPNGWYQASNTNYATQNYGSFFVWISAGETVTVSTCGSTTTDTELKLALYGTVIMQKGMYNNCGLQSRFTYTATIDGDYEIRAGCEANLACEGIVTVTRP